MNTATLTTFADCFQFEKTGNVLPMLAGTAFGAGAGAMAAPEGRGLAGALFGGALGTGAGYGAGRLLGRGAAKAAPKAAPKALREAAPAPKVLAEPAAAAPKPVGEIVETALREAPRTQQGGHTISQLVDLGLVSPRMM